MSFLSLEDLWLVNWLCPNQEQQLSQQQSQSFQQSFLNQLSKQNYEEESNHHLDGQNCHEQNGLQNLSEQLEKYKEDPNLKVINSVRHLQTQTVTNKVNYECAIYKQKL